MERGRQEIRIHSYMHGLKTRAYYLLCSQKSIPIKINTVKFNKRKKKDGLNARGSENEDDKKTELCETGFNFLVLNTNVFHCPHTITALK